MAPRVQFSLTLSSSSSRVGHKILENNLLSSILCLEYLKDSTAAAHSVDAVVWVCFHVYRIYIIRIIKEMTHERGTILTR